MRKVADWKCSKISMLDVESATQSCIRWVEIALTPVNVGVRQGSILGQLLYLIYAADLLKSPESITATFANDTAVLAADSDRAWLNMSVDTLREWQIKWWVLIYLGRCDGMKNRRIELWNIIFVIGWSTNLV
jgi:hypothetical protein